MKIKIVSALLFLLFILLVILAADTGTMPSFLAAVYDIPGGDKAGHFLLYGVLAFLLARAIPHPLRLGAFSIPLVIPALLLFAAAEEFSQLFFSTRTPDLVDLAFGCLGILVGAWLAARTK